MELKFKDLATEQYNNLKDELLDLDRRCVGGEDEVNYELEGVKYKIKVWGSWDRSNWFDYSVVDEYGNVIEKQNICYP